MAKTANLYARIEPDVKEQAESILAALGIPVSNAINMFYKQIILQRGIPFELKLDVPNETTAAAIEEGRKMMSDPSAPRYSSMDALKAALEV